MPITLYQSPMSSSSPIVWMMAELGIDHESVAIDLKGDAHKQPEFLAKNPMGQVPTLVDGDQAMFESSAITIYLGEKYGVAKGLWPEVGSTEHMRALTWVAWMAVTVGSTLRLMIATHGEWAPPERQHKALHDHARERLGELLHILDKHLDGREYLATANFSLADAFVAAAMAWVTGHFGVDVSPTPNLGAWLGRCMARESTKAMM